MPKLLKDKRIKIIYKGWNDDYTERVEEVRGELWAHFRHLSIKETYEAGADYALTNVYFTFTKPTFEFGTYNLIEYPLGSGKLWDVIGVDLFEDRDGSNIRALARPAGAEDY